MKTFTAKIEIPNKSPRYIPECTIYKGKLAQVCKKGVGKSRIEVWACADDAGEVEIFEKYEDYFKAYINSTLMAENGITQEEAKKLLDADQANAWRDERIFNCLFVMGENPNGYFVSSVEENKEMKETEILESILNKEIAINFEHGIFGLVTRRLPEKTWKLISSFGTYHKGDLEDEEWADDMGYIGVHKIDLKGWFYTKDAIKALLDAGYPVEYLGVKITCIEDVDVVYDNKKKEREKLENAQNKYNATKRDLIRSFYTLFKNAVYISEDESNKICKEKKVLFPSIDIEGHNIYGGGKYLHITDKYVYLIQNNGHDGDDWSQNNYMTGGAGAIATRIDVTAEVNDILEKIGEFESKNIQDFLE